MSSSIEALFVRVTGTLANTKLIPSKVYNQVVEQNFQRSVSNLSVERRNDNGINAVSVDNDMPLNETSEVDSLNLRVLSGEVTKSEQSVQPKNAYVYKPQNNLQVDVTGVGGMTFSGMDVTLEAQNKGHVKKLTPKKSSAFISFPVIMFVLSAMLLIGSVILLFVLD